MKQRRKRLMCLMLAAVLAVSTEAAAFAEEITVDTAVEDTVVTQELPEQSSEVEDAAPAEEDALIAEPEDGSGETSEAGEGFDAEDTADTEDASSLAEYSGDGLIVGVEEVESPELAVYAVTDSEEKTTEDGQFSYVVMTDDTTGTQTAAITGYAGEDAESVQEIQIPEKIGEIPVTEIRSDFSNCAMVESMSISKNIVKIGANKSWLLDGSDPGRSCEIGPITYEFKEYKVDEANPYFSSRDGILYNKEQTTLYRCPMGKSSVELPDSVNKLYYKSFANCHITSPLVLTSDIEVGNMAFSRIDFSKNYTTELSSIIVKKGASAQWKNGSYCFEYAKIGEFTIEYGITDFGMKGMFCMTEIGTMHWPGGLGCVNTPFYKNLGEPEYLVTDLYYGGPEAEWKKIPNIARDRIKNCHFCDHENIISTIVKEGTDTEDGLEQKICPDCGRIWNIVLETAIWKFEEFDNAGVKEARLVNYRGKDEEVIVPSVWNDLPVTCIYSKAFRENTFPKKIVIPEGVTLIRASAFFKCSNLKEIILPNSLKELSGSGIFGYTAIESLKIPDGITSIPSTAFMSCTNLSKVILPDTIEKISQGVFKDCSDNIEIIYSGTEEQWNLLQSNINFKYNDLLKTNVTICDHANTSIINQAEATCTTEGYTGDKQCDTCKKIVEAGTVIQMKDHIPVVDAAVDPTCTEAGLTEGSHCEVCNTTITAQTVVPALGHDYDEAYTTDVAPTCTDAGIQSRHCKRCDAVDETSKQEVAALGHNYVSKVTTAPTCTKDGVQTDTCSRCGDVQTTVRKATGHQWSGWTKISDATVFATEQQQRICQTCGEKETKAVGTALNPTATVNASTVTLKVKQSTKGLKVTDLAAGDSVASWKSTNTKVFTVKGNADGTCTIKGLKKGSAKLEITLASGMRKTITVKVQPGAVKTTKVTVPAKKLTVQKGAKASLKPVVTPFTSLQKVTYTSSNKKVATVTKSGVITAKQAGTAKITIKSGSKKAVVTVTVPKTKTTGITVTKEVTVKKGKTYSLKAKVAPKNSDEKITYTSANKKIATVSKTGKIKGVKKGTTTITVKSGSQTVKVQVTVK